MKYESKFKKRVDILRKRDTILRMRLSPSRLPYKIRIFEKIFHR